MKRKKVVIAMSGGVDSSVTAALLKREGYECIGMHLQMWNDSGEGREGKVSRSRNKCCTLQGLEDARRVAALLDIPFYVVNIVDQFKKHVVDYFLETYARGETPNPCIPCNRTIKFGQLLERALELGADFLATGHYAKIVFGRELRMARDRTKDQSYFLYTLSQEKLSRILFPLGDVMKSHVYQLAREFGLSRVSEKPESQGLCFFAEEKPIYFMKRYLPHTLFEAGPIVTLDGMEIGKHHGLPLYTIGQRSGLGIGGMKGETEGEPWYVVEIDPRRNRLVVGRNGDIEQLSFVCSDIHFINGEMPTDSLGVEVRIRHRGELIPATLSIHDGNVFVIATQRPFRGVASGQAAVFYEGEKVIGGGRIEKSPAQNNTRCHSVLNLIQDISESPAFAKATAGRLISEAMIAACPPKSKGRRRETSSG